jgi:FKBP-type peptidyl-prolyl cis-trans isomerase
MCSFIKLIYLFAFIALTQTSWKQWSSSDGLVLASPLPLPDVMSAIHMDKRSLLDKIKAELEEAEAKIKAELAADKAKIEAKVQAAKDAKAANNANQAPATATAAANNNNNNNNNAAAKAPVVPAGAAAVIGSDGTVTVPAQRKRDAAL